MDSRAGRNILREQGGVITSALNRWRRALTVLQATKDLRKVSLWLGHAHMQTTEMYTRADPSVKLEALEAMIAPKLRSGRFKATDKLIASLTSQSVMRSTTRSI